jgi:hypothetical protein
MATNDSTNDASNTTPLAKKYIISKVGTCAQCLNKDCEWQTCESCDSLICDDHIGDNADIPRLYCELCKYIPELHHVCIICDCSASCEIEYKNSILEKMAFSESRVWSYTIISICDYCRINYIDPMVKPRTDVRYQTFKAILNEEGGAWLGGIPYDLFREGNEINYKLIQDGRKKILDTYKKVVPMFILPGVAGIIIEYCGFARSIIFEEG